MFLPTCSKSFKNYDHNLKMKSQLLLFYFHSHRMQSMVSLFLAILQLCSKYVFHFGVPLCILCLFSLSENEPSEQKDRRPAPGPYLLEQEVFSMGSHLLGLFTDKNLEQLSWLPRHGLFLLRGHWTLESWLSCRQVPLGFQAPQ